MKSMILSSAIVAALGGSALATTTTNDTLLIPFTPGDGNSNTNFAIFRATEAAGPFAGNAIEMGLKGKQRFFGDTLPITGNLYEAQPGFSPTSGVDPTPALNRAWWNFDFSINLGGRDVSNTLVNMSIVDIEGDVFSLNFDTSVGVPPTTSLIQDSWNIGFGFIQTPLLGFNPNLPGDYNIQISAGDIASGQSLGSVNIVVRVVPAPGALALMGVCGFVATRRRRD